MKPHLWLFTYDQRIIKKLFLKYIFLLIFDVRFLLLDNVSYFKVHSKFNISYFKVHSRFKTIICPWTKNQGSSMILKWMLHIRSYLKSQMRSQETNILLFTFMSCFCNMIKCLMDLWRGEYILNVGEIEIIYG